MKNLTFDTDAAAVAGVGVERNSGETSIHLPRGAKILAIKQPAGAVLANDSDWVLWVDYKDTGQIFTAESLDPVNDGGVKLGPSGIRIHPGAMLSMHWQGQAVAQANAVTVYYD